MCLHIFHGSQYIFPYELLSGQEEIIEQFMGTHYVRTQSIIKNFLCKGLILWGDLNARKDFPSEMALDMVAGEEKMR